MAFRGSRQWVRSLEGVFFVLVSLSLAKQCSLKPGTRQRVPPGPARGPTRLLRYFSRRANWLSRDSCRHPLINYPLFDRGVLDPSDFSNIFLFLREKKRGINCARIDGWRVFRGREWIFDRTFIFNVCSFNVLDLSWYINIGRNKYKGGIPFKRSEDVCQKNPSPPGNARNLLIGHVNEGNREFSYGLTNRVVASFDVEK